MICKTIDFFGLEDSFERLNDIRTVRNVIDGKVSYCLRCYTVDIKPYLYFVPGCLGLKDVRIIIPSAVERGKGAKLRCLYDMESDPLYTVKWYKNDREFFRYTPQETPKYKQFPTQFLHVVEELSNATDVVLDSVSIESSGLFTCEISADAPSFYTGSANGTLKVSSTTYCGLCESNN